MMTENELINLPFDKLFEFTLYYGEKCVGYPDQRTDGWYIVRPTSNGNIEKKIVPAQIDTYEVITENSFSNNKSVSTQIEGQPKFKTLVIVGAGASFDYSFKTDVSKPPLAKDLFNDDYSDLISNFAGVENLSSQILQAPDIETYFQQQWDKIVNSHNPILLNKLIDVQFYLHFLFEKVSKDPDFRKNNYSSFFQSLRDHLIEEGDNQKALIVSFNYDTLLEQSLTKAFNYSYNSLDDYINFEQRRFALFKPHGSWNWVKNFNSQYINSLKLTSNPTTNLIRDVLYDSNISLGTITSNLSQEPTIVNHEVPYYFPHLLIPYKNKDSFVMPDKHLTLLTHFLKDVEKIIIIGWKGSEENFKKLLNTTLGNKKISIKYVNAKDKTVEEELANVFKSVTFEEVSPFANGKSSFTELNNFIQQYPKRIFSDISSKLTINEI